MLYMSSQGGARGGGLTDGPLGRMWSQVNMGDPEVFSRAMLTLRFDPPPDVADPRELFYGTPIRARHCENFMRIFGRLLEQAAECDPSGIIRDALKGSSHGYLYDRMVEYTQDGPAPG
jgi:hypothetical protein